MNILLVILDGIADRPQPALAGKTPLEVAHTPHLDRLAALGCNGMLVPLAPGVPLESEMAHFLLFGYQLEEYPGRTAFEALGRGVDVLPSTVVLLASFTSTTMVEGALHRELLLREDPQPKNEEDCQLLSQTVARYETQGIQFTLQSCGRCEAILTLSGNPSRFLSDVDPFYKGAVIARPLPLSEDPDQENARRTAAALQEYLTWAYHRLQGHAINQERRRHAQPLINFLVTKWAAVIPDIPSFADRNGLRAASIENSPLYTGIARACGMLPVNVPRCSDVAADFREKLRAADQLWARGYEFVHVHSKGPDVAAHRKDPVGKMQTIAALDAMLGPLVKEIEEGKDLLVAITGDHATPSSGPLIHSGEAVPLVIVGGPNVLADAVNAFHERAVVHGGLGRVYGKDLMPMLLNLTDRVCLYGVRHQRHMRPYWTWQPEPFIVSKG